MKKTLTIAILLLSTVFLASSCDDFLNTLPDNRAELDSEDKIKNLLVSAYPNATSAMMREYWSDNWDSHDWNLNFDNYMEGLWNWKDNPDRSGNDHTHRTWELHYLSISTCNEVLDAIKARGNPTSLESARAEALVARAWNHFELATLFCLPYGESSKTDMGLPYVTIPEKIVRPNYERGTVAEFYEKIKTDLEEGLPGIDNSLYTQAKFHFNTSAANAFATKFYMVYGDFEKAIKHATRVLTNHPPQVLRNWSATKSMSMDNSEQPDAYMDKNNPATLLMHYPTSGWGTSGANNYSSGNKYSHSQLVAKYETLHSTGPWGTQTNIHVRTWWNASTNKIFHRKLAYHFEYTDPVARIGYSHVGLVLFTTDEVLLYRAEAYALTKQYTKAYEDIDTFIRNYTNSTPSYTDFVSFYKNLKVYHPEEVFEKDEQGFDQVVQSPTPKKPLNPPLYKLEYGTDQEWLLHGILHLRRILLMGEGQRWLDINRYGITIHRRLVDRGHRVVEISDEMKPDDKRRAMQIPQDAINAGCPANPR